ncbi:MAG: phage tail tip lysozyme [Firmicutes bacterium]|nr:phage tail tip lysozyme [Bacillota bacterium]
MKKNKLSRKIIIAVLSVMLVVTMAPTVTFADSGTRVITSFAPLETDEYYFNGNPTEEEIASGLPSTIAVYLNGSDKVTPIDVTWECVENFDNTDFYYYSMKPVWSECYVLSDNMDSLWDVPWLTIYRLASDEAEVSETEPEVDAIADEGEQNLEPVYTEEDGTIDVTSMFVEECFAESAETTSAVYRYLTEKLGLNKAAACGVMANIYAESGMVSNNLENTYNVLYGLTDSEYTRRVDAGKGAYKTPAGKSRNFRTDYCGYGLCQWTSLGRRENLIEKAIAGKVSVSDVDMQLEFLGEELKNSYPQVWATLKGVPNTPAGVYLAAREFCVAFEIPANRYTVSVSRAKTALSKYWVNYCGMNAGSSADSYLGICGYTYPGNVKKGKGFSAGGMIFSNYTITSASASIVNSSGKAVYSKTAKPNTHYKNISDFDENMKFSALSAGTYSYNISAKDSSGKTVSVSHKFTVSSAAKTVNRGVATGNTAAATPPQETKPASSTTTKATTASSSSSYKVKVVSPVNYRTGPGTKYKKKGVYKKGKVLTVVSKSNGWGKLSNGYYVALKHTKKVTSKSSYKVKTTSRLNYRTGPGTKYKKKGVYKKGKVLTVVSKSNGWGKLSNGYYVILKHTKKL